MFKGLIIAAIIACSHFISPPHHFTDCKKPDARYQRMDRDDCREKPHPTPTPRYTPTPTPTPTDVCPNIDGIQTKLPDGYIFNQDHLCVPKPNPLSIKEVEVHECTPGSSCYGWLTNIEVEGTGFAPDSRVKVHLDTQFGGDYFGNYVGGNGKTRILTDFTGLPHCQHFDVYVFGSTGTAGAEHTIISVCP